MKIYKRAQVDGYNSGAGITKVFSLGNKQDYEVMVTIDSTNDEAVHMLNEIINSPHIFK